MAFRILNTGRFKLGAACIGGARNCLRAMVTYAKQRHAFGKPISEFGLVRQMIADCALGLFGSESAVYRTAAWLDAEADVDAMGVECALIKVEASEMLDGVVDRAVQIHGGNGFMRGNPAERAYRDARVNRIFEGTNEINRLLMTGLLLKQAQAGKLPLVEALGQLRGELLAAPRNLDWRGSQPGCAERPAGMSPEEQARKATLLVAGAAFERFGEGLAQEEEMLGAIADLMIAVYVMQSVAVRRPGSTLAQVIAAESLDRVEMTARRALAQAAEGDALRTQLAWLRRLLRREPVNVLGLRREIAAAALEAGGYPG